ncbi:MAG TPA: AarF/UbiB family protein, partial [Pirellulales bacterium]
MRLSPFPRLYRNLNRSLEVAGILSKYGLADWIHRHDVEFAKGIFKTADGVKIAETSLPIRIRLALSELGPTFIKLGQMLSTRADIVGAEIANELQGLLTDAPADPPDVVRSIVGVELGRPVDVVFAEFDDVPLASASIGQVHAAMLRSGERVVVKVQHAQIEHKIRDDLEILVGLAEMAEGRPELVNFRPRATAFEFQRSILRELDFSREERNLTEFRNQFGENLHVAFPQPYPEYSTSRVLTMQRFDGIRISDVDALRIAGFDLADLAKRGANVFLTMIFEARFYHADPHPGNILVLPDGKIGVLDCGMVARLDDRMAEDIGDLFMAIHEKDVERMLDAVLRLGEAPTNLDRSGLQFDLADFTSQYAAVPVDKLDLSSALNDVV